MKAPIKHRKGSPKYANVRFARWNLLEYLPLKYHRLAKLLVLTNFVSIGFFVLRFVGAENTRYWFMLWNLTLAWVAPLIAWYLFKRLNRTSWGSWFNIALTVLWLGFLPNSFYIVTDMIHLKPTGEINIIFDAVLLTSFVFNGFIAGFIGTFLVHKQLLHRLSSRVSMAIVTGVFILSSYAIYLGRVLRWNTWDALLHPAGLLFDISDNIIHPLDHLQSFVVTISFTVLITSFYLLFWELLQALRPNRTNQDTTTDY